MLSIELIRDQEIAGAAPYGVRPRGAKTSIGEMPKVPKSARVVIATSYDGRT
jgi:hypothetical protein